MISLPKYAYIDLATKEYEVKVIPEEYFKKYLGGKALAARLLLDLYPTGVGALEEDSVLIINTGPLNGTGSPSSSRFNMSFKSVLSGGIASSNCGGTFGVMLKRAGLDGLVIKGKANNPIHINIADGEIEFFDASSYWGMDTEKTQEALPSHFGKLVIGPAGEHLVSYASAVSGERVAGRCGAGAVMGSKYIKAITAYGSSEIPIENKAKFDKYISKWVGFIKKHPMTGDSLPSYGSAGLVNKANASSALPTKNFTYGYYGEAEMVSGETLADTLLVRNSGCISCPIRCERRVIVDGKEVKGPEYETLGLFGPNMLSSDMETILKINYQCDLLGLDTITAASTIACAMEMKEKGIVDFGVNFSDTTNLCQVLEDIANRKGKYTELANGSKWLSEKYGVPELAIQSKGLELASYEPRRSVGMGLGYATSNRGGCHLNGGYLALLESGGVLTMDPLATKSKAPFTVFMQDSLDAVSSSGSCLFTAQTLIPAPFFKLGPNHWFTRFIGKILTNAGFLIRMILGMLKILRFNSMYLLPHAEATRLATGLPIYTGSFVLIGTRGYNLERIFSIREGLTSAGDSLPSRLTETLQDENNPKTKVDLKKMLPKYYNVRGWSNDGIPTVKKLKYLKIEV